MFQGSCVALVTPFKDGVIDELKVKELVEYHIRNKTSALVPCGTTGECATLSHEEHRYLIDLVVRLAKRRIPVIAGVGSNSTTEAIDLAQFAKDAGADAVLAIVPYYNKPTQRGLVQHFKAMSRNVSIPMIIYNIPGRTTVNMLPRTLMEILKTERNIVGIKESSGDLEQVTKISMMTKNIKNFSLLSGDDTLTLPILSIGGKGVISVLANIAPKDVLGLIQSFKSGNLNKARTLHEKMFPLIKSLFIETNPAPIKMAMELLGMCSSDIRLPMIDITPESKKILLMELKKYGLLKGKR